MMGKSEINTYRFHHSEFAAILKIAKSQTKPSFKECAMKFFEVHSTTKYGIHKSISLNYFYILRVVKQAGVDNSNSLVSSALK